MEDIVIADNTGLSRVEALIQTAVAGYAEYEELETARMFTHTIVSPEYEGRGVGSALARGALDLARSQGKTVLPRCPFIKAWIGKHPEYADLVGST
ncbi:MAG: GNAT family N-acetyltransferase [Actinomycetes bacterium]